LALAANANGDIVASFKNATVPGGSTPITGVYLRPAGSSTWHQILAGTYATELAIDGSGRVVAQTPVYGVQVWTPGQTPGTGSWASLGSGAFNGAQWTPDASAVAVSPSGDIVASFNNAPGYGGTGSYTGVYLRPAGSSTWYQILASHATELAMDGAGRVVAQTPGYGVQVWTPGQTPGVGGWNSLGTSVFGTTQWTPDASAVSVNANGDIVASFNNVTGHDGSGLYTGTYIRRAGSTQWQLLTPKYTFTIAIGPDGLVAGQFD
jgi:hypothetical protein